MRNPCKGLKPSCSNHGAQVRVYPTLESDLPDMQAAAAQQALSLQVRWACALAANAVDLTAPPLLAAAVACSNSPQHRRDRMAACATAARSDLLLSG